MLCLTRKVNDRLYITVGTEEVELVVLAVGGRVKLGINCGGRVNVVRGELRHVPRQTNQTWQGRVQDR